MANSDSTQTVCWDAPDQFSFNAQLLTPDGQPHTPGPKLINLDTGYDGEVLVPYDLYISSGLKDWEFPQAHWSTGLTASGEPLVMPISRAVLAIPELGLRLSVVVDTFEGNNELLIGRALIRQLRVLLDGPASKTCILPPETKPVNP